MRPVSPPTASIRYKKRSALIVSLILLSASQALAGPTGGDLSASANVRFFGGDEKATYYNIDASYNLANMAPIEFLGAFARWSDFGLSGGGAIRHGGTDLELRLHSQQKLGELSSDSFVGVSEPHTPAQGGTHLTLGESVSYHCPSRTTAYAEPLAVLIDGNSLFGIAIGADQGLSDALSLSGEFIPVLAGENTRSTADGHLQRAATYKVGLGYKLSSNLKLSAGYTNQIGDTTAFSLTPALGSSGAVYVEIGGKF